MDVISLYDYTGEMLRPWARFSKVNCYAYDIQHVGQSLRGGINYVHADLHDENVLWDIVCRHKDSAAIVFGFPSVPILRSAEHVTLPARPQQTRCFKIAQRSTLSMFPLSPRRSTCRTWSRTL